MYPSVIFAGCRKVAGHEADRTHCVGENGKEWVFVPRLLPAAEADLKRGGNGATVVSRTVCTHQQAGQYTSQTKAVYPRPQNCFSCAVCTHQQAGQYTPQTMGSMFMQTGRLVTWIPARDLPGVAVEREELANQVKRSFWALVVVVVVVVVVVPAAAAAALAAVVVEVLVV